MSIRLPSLLPPLRDVRARLAAGAPAMVRALPLFAFLAVAVIGIAGAGFALATNERAERIRFEAMADDAVNRLEARLSRYMLLLEATAAYFEAERGAVSASEFARFAAELELGQRHEGVAVIGYVPLVRASDRFSADHGDLRPVVGEAASGGLAAPVTRLVTADAPEAPALGRDAYADPVHREAMQAAAARGAPQATAGIAVRPASEAGGAGGSGVSVYVPIYATGDAAGATRPERPTGYVFASFRIEELAHAVLSLPPWLPIRLSVFDEGVAEPMFSYGGEPVRGFGEHFRVERSLAVAGREWTLVFEPGAGYRRTVGQGLAVALGAVSLLLAAALAASLRAQSQAHAAAGLLAKTMERSLAEKEMLLQEMKHRLKNAIARILAMARHTAARADSVEAFTTSFTQRLEAMARAQDMLTRSKVERADLRRLLEAELVQVFGDDAGTVALAGPDVSLDETTTQALGLTFHELATNALKYGGLRTDVPAISVEWEVAGPPGGRRLALVWQEASAGELGEPGPPGFGSRLIDSAIRLELGGAIRRSFAANGLRIEITLPLERAAPRPLGPNQPRPARPRVAAAPPAVHPAE